MRPESRKSDRHIVRYGKTGFSVYSQISQLHPALISPNIFIPNNPKADL